MGMDQSVRFDPKGSISLPEVREILATRDLTLQMRMIDGELAFPNEEPSENWNELRVAIGSGMITLRRAEDGIQLIVWGNADPQLRQSWNALTWAIAKATHGKIAGTNGLVDLEQFAKEADLPANWIR